MIAIIPARGGSKGLPNKNIKFLNGKPLIAHTIGAARKSREIERVIVSTDSEEIAAIAIKFGAEVPFFRPDYLTTDTAMAIDNYIYTINRLEKEFAISITDFIVLQPTSPLRNSYDIDEAIRIYKNNKADSVISYTEEAHPVYWHKKINSQLEFEDIFDHEIVNRQAYQKTYYPNGAVFVFSVKLIRAKKYYSKNSYAYIMPRLRSIDIDTIDDFEYAEFILNKRKS